MTRAVVVGVHVTATVPQDGSPYTTGQVTAERIEAILRDAGLDCYCGQPSFNALPDTVSGVRP